MSDLAARRLLSDNNLCNPHRLDLVLVERFIAGRAAHTALSEREKRTAARRMLDEGISAQEAQTRLGWSYYRWRTTLDQEAAR